MTPDDDRQDERDDGQDRSADGGRSDEERNQGIGGRILSASPLIWVLLVAAVAFGVWASLSDGGNQPTARAVVLDTAQTQRTVVALPCGVLGGRSAGSDPARMPGAITAVLPEGGGERIVAVTGCSSSGSGAASLTGGGGGTVLVVPPAGVEVPDQDSQAKKLIRGMELGAVTRLEGPAEAQTVVIPACPTSRTGGSMTRTTVSAQPAGDGIVVVPCPSGK